MTAMRRISQIEAEEIEFLAPGIPVGMIVNVSGRPGEGKSTWAVDLGSRVSQVGAVIASMHEDHAAYTLRPRFEAAKVRPPVRVDAFVSGIEDLLPVEPDGDLLIDVLASEPEPKQLAGDRGLDDVAAAFGDLADLKAAVLSRPRAPRSRACRAGCGAGRFGRSG